MPSEISTGKTVFILAAVVGCFAILWPRLFHPMLQSALYPESPLEKTSGCCDVISDMDVNAAKILTEMCGRIVTKHSELDAKFLADLEQGKMSKEVVSTCKREVLNTCGVDITSFLAEQVGIGRTYRQILDNIKSFNNSVCLKQNFGLERSLLGAARHWSHSSPKNLRQERPPHMRPDLINAALRERGRAIPHSDVVPRILEGRPGPIPGMRPPMGGAGHVVPPPKGTQGALGILMPLYTIGIVMIFVYTMMKLLTRRSVEVESANNFQSDPNFRHYVFGDQHGGQNGTNKYCYDQPTKLVETAISGLLAEVDRQRENVTKQAEQPSGKGENGLQAEPKREAESDPEAASVKVVNMETTASCEGGKPWTGSRPSTPTTPRSRPPSRPPTPLERETATIPPPQDAQEIYLEGALPSQAQLLVAESETEAHKAAPGEVDLENSNDPPVILSGKMTLSLIPDPLAHGSDDEGHTGRDSGQESEPEDAHGASGSEHKAHPDGNSTNSIQVEPTDQSELSDHFEDSIPFENFDYSVNLNMNVLETFTKTNEKEQTITNKQEITTVQNVNGSKLRHRSKKGRKAGASKNGTENVEGDEEESNEEILAIAAVTQDASGIDLVCDESDVPLVVQGEKKKKISFVCFDDDVEEDEVQRADTMFSATFVEDDGEEMPLSDDNLGSDKSDDQEEDFERLTRLSSLDEEYLRDEINNIIEEAIECVQHELQAKQYESQIEYVGEDEYEDEEVEGEEEEEEFEVEDEEEEELEGEHDDDVGSDIRHAIKESEKMRKAVHDKVEEVKSSMTPITSTQNNQNIAESSMKGRVLFADLGKSQPEDAEEEEYEEEELEDEEIEDEEVDEEEETEGEETEEEEEKLVVPKARTGVAEAVNDKVVVDHGEDLEDEEYLEEEEVDEEEEVEVEDEETEDEEEPDKDLNAVKNVKSD